MCGERMNEGGVSAAGSRVGTIRVLLADDDEAYLDSLSRLIGRLPELAVVATATDGLGAIELTDALDPDAVVIDLHMPHLDGVTAVARLRRDHPDLCVIAITGDPDRALQLAVVEAGADDVLLKSDILDGLTGRLAALQVGS
jgi:DNA-binding NarL/FixJ family response regulator